MVKENKKSSSDKAKPISICSLIVSIASAVIAIVSIVTNVNLQKRNEYLEDRAKKDSAIPIFRLAAYDDMCMKMMPYIPNSELSEVDGMKECYFSIRGFSFENMTDTIATISHIEYGNEAFELENTQLIAEKDEIISFSEDSLFIGTEYENEFFIIVKTIYNEYYSYKCTLYSEGVEEAIDCYSVASIDMPTLYDVNNEVYQNRYIPVRDITINPPGGIRF